MPSFGEELRRERELRQISLREISEVTKINIRYLEALERNEFDRLPGGVFNKGFVRAFSEFIGVDAEGMVNAYLLEVQGQEGYSEQQDLDLLRGDPFTKADGGDSSHEGSRGKLMFIGGAIVIAAIAIAVVVWQMGILEKGNEEVTPTEAADTGPVSAVETVHPAQPDSTIEPGPEDQSPVTDDPEQIEEAEAIPTTEDARANEPRTVVARVILDRTTRGKINCDNRRVTILDGLAEGTSLEFECRSFLVIDAADGGALRVGMHGGDPAFIGAAGEPVTNFRILPTTAVIGDAGGTQGVPE